VLTSVSPERRLPTVFEMSWIFFLSFTWVLAIVRSSLCSYAYTSSVHLKSCGMSSLKIWTSRNGLGSQFLPYTTAQLGQGTLATDRHSSMEHDLSSFSFYYKHLADQIKNLKWFYNNRFVSLWWSAPTVGELCFIWKERAAPAAFLFLCECVKVYL